MKVDLSGLHTVRAGGKTYVYAWRGGPRLTQAPGTDAFLEELLDARREQERRRRRGRQREPAPTTAARTGGRAGERG